jgi:hypothetical protein
MKQIQPGVMWFQIFNIPMFAEKKDAPNSTAPAGTESYKNEWNILQYIDFHWNLMGDNGRL